jgi:hypothetical protein
MGVIAALQVPSLFTVFRYVSFKKEKSQLYRLIINIFMTK